MSNLFDLNMEKVLENWLVSDALREIIANALDETVLTESPDIKIYKDSNKVWHIRDKVIIKRSVLSNPVLFCEVLAHELCHHQHGYFDNTRDFENDLSSMLGFSIYHCIKNIADEDTRE